MRQALHPAPADYHGGLFSCKSYAIGQVTLRITELARAKPPRFR
jgi:hypothetical protein